MKTRPYFIHYHISEYQSKINRCWGNSLGYSLNAHNVIDAIKKFTKKVGKDKPIYSIQAFHPTVDLDYDATQKLLKMEGFLVDSRHDVE